MLPGRAASAPTGYALPIPENGAATGAYPPPTAD